MNTSSKGTALITGASSGIGAIYADRLASRGHDLILVARNQERLHALATRLTDDTGRSVEVIVADLTNKTDLARVEQVLRTDASITLLVNNAGTAMSGDLASADPDRLESIIQLNVLAPSLLALAAIPGFVVRGSGTLINISSASALVPERFNGSYSGTKAYLLNLSLRLQQEVASKGVRVHVVLPGATRTAIWEKAGTDIATLPPSMLMDVDEMVDAALVGLDRGESVTIPSLPDIADWEAYEAARQNMIPKLSLSSPAARYGVTTAKVTPTRSLNCGSVLNS
jgi:short-subunit dehydrogenase